MQITDWYREYLLDEPYGFELYMRSTPSFRGVVIDPKHGNYYGDGEYSPRRYSAIIKYHDETARLIVGSVSYGSDGFDSEDISEPIEKFLMGSFHILMDITVEMDSIEEWNGSVQQLQAKYGHYLADPTWPIDIDDDVV